MAVFANPNIVEDGLVLYLDTGNERSYPGSGTTWYDLSGNGNNGTLVNGATFSSVNGGVFVLDGVNDYINIDLNLTNQSYTIFGAARYVTIGGRTFSARNNNWLMGHWAFSTVKHYAVGWVSSATNTEESDTNWRSYAATGDYSADIWKLYVNGYKRVENNGGVNGPNNFAIGSYAGADEFSNSHISFMMAYNRVLTDSEIKQNYNALRGRFGL